MESNLALSLVRLGEEIGNYRGFGPVAASWSGWNAIAPYTASSPDTQLAEVMRYIDSGLRQAYWPPPVEGFPAPRWSFLTPEWSMATVASKQAYDLPDDFGGFEGPLAYDPSFGYGIRVNRVGIGDIRQQASATPNLTTRPDRYALVPKRTDGSQGQRDQLWFWPIPDQVYTLYGRYNVLPDTLNILRPYPYGGASHGEMILESCLAVAEMKSLPDETTHREAFKARLEASLSIDARQYAPDKLGYNGDRSDRYGRGNFCPPLQTVSYVGFVGP